MVWLVIKFDDKIFGVNYISIIYSDTDGYCIDLSGDVYDTRIKFKSKQGAEFAYQTLWDKIASGEKFIDFNRLDINTGLWKAW